MTKVIARVHPVHLMNVDWAPGGRQPFDQASQLELLVSRKLAATIHIHHHHCYHYSAHKLILILPSHWGDRLSRSRHCSKGAQPMPKAVYCSSCRHKHNHPRRDSNLGPLTPQSGALTTRPLRDAIMVPCCKHLPFLLMCQSKQLSIVTDDYCINPITKHLAVIVASDRPWSTLSTCGHWQNLNLLHEADDDAVIWLECTATAALAK